MLSLIEELKTNTFWSIDDTWSKNESEDEDLRSMLSHIMLPLYSAPQAPDIMRFKSVDLPLPEAPTIA